MFIGLFKIFGLFMKTEEQKGRIVEKIRKQTLISKNYSIDHKEFEKIWNTISYDTNSKFNNYIYEKTGLIVGDRDNSTHRESGFTGKYADSKCSLYDKGVLICYRSYDDCKKFVWSDAINSHNELKEQYYIKIKKLIKGRKEYYLEEKNASIQSDVNKLLS